MGFCLYLSWLFLPSTMEGWCVFLMMADSSSDSYALGSELPLGGEGGGGRHGRRVVGAVPVAPEFQVVWKENNEKNRINQRTPSLLGILLLSLGGDILFLRQEWVDSVKTRVMSLRPSSIAKEEKSWDTFFLSFSTHPTAFISVCLESLPTLNNKA